MQYKNPKRHIFQVLLFLLLDDEEYVFYDVSVEPEPLGLLRVGLALKVVHRRAVD